jgi:hypothetical protein
LTALVRDSAATQMSGADSDKVPAADNHLFENKAVRKGPGDITTITRKNFLELIK